MKKLTLTLMLLTSILFSAEVWSGYKEITSDYIVGSGDILTIDPGTIVRFEHNSRLIIDRGQLIAIGTESEPIRLTSLETTTSGFDYWAGIEFYESGNSKDSSFMKYCTIDNIDKTKQKALEGSISALRSVIAIGHCNVQYNKAVRGGGLNLNSCGAHLYGNEIMNNEATLEGGGIYINNLDGGEWVETIIEKNLIKDNIVSGQGAEQFGGGGISIFDPVSYPNEVYIIENDIINNGVYRDAVLYGSGGGINISLAGEFAEINLVGNKIMYNQALNAGGGWVECSVTDGFNAKNFIFSNNIISNNSGFDYGGFYFNTGKVQNPGEIKFFNNNFVNNSNTGGKTGAGGLSIIHNNNYFQIINSIFWDNKKGGETSDIGIVPYVGFDKFTSFCNSTSGMEGQGNMSSLSIFNRVVVAIGADPYENFLRGNYHLSLRSPCVDKGDPDIVERLSLDPKIYFEQDNTDPNIGAWGLTLEATTSQYEELFYTKPTSVFVEQGQVLLMNCEDFPEQIVFDDIVVADGGQFFISPNEVNNTIRITYLEVAGQKIGDEYTTRFEKLVTSRVPKISSYVLDVQQMNCTGVDFSDMAVNIISDKPLTLKDSRIYIKENDPESFEESGINIVASMDFNIHNNVIANFDYGICTPSKKGKLSKGRITNNTITFDVGASQKGNEKKGIVVDNSDVDLDDNEIVNPDEGIEATQSSGRITNNTITFDVGASQKGALKKGIYIYGSDFEITSNTIVSNDILTSSISGIEVENSSVSASYNVINFAKYDSKVGTYYGFFTTALGPNSQFINNTINNATFGFYNEGDADPTDFINNIVWGDIDGHVSSDRNILVAYNNDILGEMSGLLEEKNCFTLNPTYKSVKISDFYLDGKSKCVESGWFVEGFHEYGVNYYGDYPDRGALEFYIAISLSSPTNINISATSTIATVSWNSVTNANSYKIYRTTDPYGTYSLYTSTSNTYYNVPISGLSKYFYHIVASTDAKGELDNNESIELDKNTITIKKTKVKILRKEEELSNR